MLGPTIVEIIEIIIFTFIVIFAIRTYLVHFIESNSSFKNIFLITLIVIIFISSAISIGFCIDLNGVLIKLATEINQMSIELIEMFEHQKEQLKQLLIMFGIIQGISLLMLTILYRNIKHELKNIYADSKKRSKWDKIIDEKQ